MAAHQVLQVTERRAVNFLGSSSYMPAKHTLSQLELRRLLELFQSDMHNACGGISVFINFCVHICVLVCICVCCSEGCLTPNRCHYFPLSSSRLSMSAEVFLLFCLCYFVCVCVCVQLCVRRHTWMSVWCREGGWQARFCASVCVYVCVW